MENKELPRICYVLGGEKTPLKIGEIFEFEGGKYEVGKDGISYKNDFILWPPATEIIKMVNHPEKIIRSLQFSEDEKAFMRMLVKVGFQWIARDQDNSIYAFLENPEMVSKAFGGSYFVDRRHFAYRLPTKLLPQITFENSPINCLDYVSENG